MSAWMFLMDYDSGHKCNFAGSVKLQTGRITKLLAMHHGKVKEKRQL